MRDLCEISTLPDEISQAVLIPDENERTIAAELVRRIRSSDPQAEAE